jgi:predicted  nucleic acid-binding Zn-ribbon protein
MEQVKLREMAIADLQKKISEAETKLKQQQNLYEAVRVDRNMYSKNLIESQDEIQEMKQVQDHEPPDRTAQGRNWGQGSGAGEGAL